MVAPALPRNDPAGAQIRNLAALLRLRKENRSPFVLMLGAGASLSSGVPPTQTIQQQLVDQYGQNLTGDLGARFNTLWEGTSRDDRGMLLKPFLGHLGLQPSPGYEALARLIAAGYFELVVTFNYDDLVERALQGLAFTNFKVVQRGETESEEILRLVRKPAARLTLLKLHGGVRSTDTFLFSYAEMANYPPDVQALLDEVTRRPIIVCGYGFNDLCVMKAFCSAGDEAVFCVNPEGAPPNLRYIQASRKSIERVIDRQLGYFDNFFAALEQELKGVTEIERPRLNPFKFLDSYDLGDHDWYFGRRRLIRRTLVQLDGPDRRESLHLIGPEKAGKTSFVRAGLLSRLDPSSHERIYLRCRPDLERQLVDLGAQRLDRDPAELTLEEALDALVSGEEGRRTVLVLDQFERVLQANSRNEQGWQKLAPVFRALSEHGRPRLAIVFVSVDAEGLYYKLIVKSRLDLDPIEVKPLKPRLVAAILERAARRSGFRFEPWVLQTLVKRLDEPSFTLAHLQAICYLLVQNGWLDEGLYRQHVSRDLEVALDSAINRLGLPQLRRGPAPPRGEIAAAQPDEGRLRAQQAADRQLPQGAVRGHPPRNGVSGASLTASRR